MQPKSGFQGSKPIHHPNSAQARAGVIAARERRRALAEDGDPEQPAQLALPLDQLFFDSAGRLRREPSYWSQLATRAADIIRAGGPSACAFSLLGLSIYMLTGLGSSVGNCLMKDLRGTGLDANEKMLAKMIADPLAFLLVGCPLAGVHATAAIALNRLFYNLNIPHDMVWNRPDVDIQEVGERQIVARESKDCKRIADVPPFFQATANSGTQVLTVNGLKITFSLSAAIGALLAVSAAVQALENGETPDPTTIDTLLTLGPYGAMFAAMFTAGVVESAVAQRDGGTSRADIPMSSGFGDQRTFAARANGGLDFSLSRTFGLPGGMLFTRSLCAGLVLLMASSRIPPQVAGPAVGVITFLNFVQIVRAWGDALMARGETAQSLATKAAAEPPGSASRRIYEAVAAMARLHELQQFDDRRSPARHARLFISAAGSSILSAAMVASSRNEAAWTPRSDDVCAALEVNPASGLLLCIGFAVLGALLVRELAKQFDSGGVSFFMPAGPDGKYPAAPPRASTNQQVGVSVLAGSALGAGVAAGLAPAYALPAVIGGVAGVMYGAETLAPPQQASGPPCHSRRGKGKCSGKEGTTAAISTLPSLAGARGWPLPINMCAKGCAPWGVALAPRRSPAVNRSRAFATRSPTSRSRPRSGIGARCVTSAAFSSKLLC